ncbi:hypothetical protein SAMN05444003_3317 [Cognatiyoonia sediminum]|uniref:Uncharacterized protein n=1 Tax=Cognatiyoonia sediminum TaxID=1508389 RepID=A0A1M5TBJ1_9RHOB|nr:hypothetical protein SAMN05444003_3317 [Cognatiyoonia sediminum]
MWQNYVVPVKLKQGFLDGVMLAAALVYEVM